jgi:UDP-N-acetyl-D-galactosamine dehydrogenase
LHKAELLLLGVTFKENCPDVRNTKIVDIVHALKEYGINITIYDPWAKPEEVLHEYGIVTTKTIPLSQFDAVILGVSHTVFNTLDINSLTKSNNVVYDVKGFLTAEVDGRL